MRYFGARIALMRRLAIGGCCQLLAVGVDQEAQPQVTATTHRNSGILITGRKHVHYSVAVPGASQSSSVASEQSGQR